MSERVWCVAAELVHAARPREGFWALPTEAAAEFAGRLLAAGRFLDRGAVETDETERQVIPYLLLRAAGRYFTYRRLAGGGEARLVHLHSVGVGGHINDDHLVVDPAACPLALRPNLLADGLGRELDEELVLPPGAVTGMVLHGFLALDATPVDRVHLGVVVIAEIDPARVEQVDVREQDKLAGVGWLTPQALRERRQAEPFEGWSRAVIDAGLP